MVSLLSLSFHLSVKKWGETDNTQLLLKNRLFRYHLI